MSKKIISYSTKHQQLIITGNKIQSVNKREMQMMNRIDTSCIMRVSFRKETPPVRLIADTQGLVQMHEYLKTVTMTKKLFVCIINSILGSLEYAESIHFSKDLFIYDTNYAFVRVTDTAVVLTYIPLQPCALDKTISDLFGSIISESTFDPQEDISYISNFLEIIKNKSFSLYVLKAYLEFICESEFGSQKTVGDNQTMCPRCNSPLFEDATKCTLCGFVIKQNTPVDQIQPNTVIENKTNSSKQSLVVNEDSAGNVTVFRATSYQERYLVCRNSGIRTLVSKSPFRIGKLIDTSDLRIENHAVSRKHAEIVKEGNNYYVIDYYSKNGTYINNRRIQSGVKELLQINDMIRFADSEYEFK